MICILDVTSSINTIGKVSTKSYGREGKWKVEKHRETPSRETAWQKTRLESYTWNAMWCQTQEMVCQCHVKHVEVITVLHSSCRCLWRLEVCAGLGVCQPRSPRSVGGCEREQQKPAVQKIGPMIRGSNNWLVLVLSKKIQVRYMSPNLKRSIDNGSIKLLLYNCHSAQKNGKMKLVNLQQRRIQLNNQLLRFIFGSGLESILI